MGSETVIHPPENLDWPTWVTRWDRMQERYLVGRDERFAIISRLIIDTQGDSPVILDLGCGTGSLMAAILDAIPGATAFGIDLDPTLLWLAEKRLAKYGLRAKVLQIDLRNTAWLENFQQPCDAIVSATALHWLSPAQLSALYPQIASLLHPGGLFLNADHVASENPVVQAAWAQHRDLMRAGQSDPTADNWDDFWKAYLAILGPEALAAREQALGSWQGVEDGLPLAWHFDHLRQVSFSVVDCFWRLDCDAIYGGVLP
jgi:SAM-dependent methyltransferase